ncbi:MAG: hypothetical protein AB4041_06850 [Microcystaceae cyanobacterium]
MTNSTLSPNSPLDSDHAIWENLKQAIAASSGFQQWQDDQATNLEKTDQLDHRVRDYLRDTLETLAY